MYAYVHIYACVFVHADKSVCMIDSDMHVEHIYHADSYVIS